MAKFLETSNGLLVICSELEAELEGVTPKPPLFIDIGGSMELHCLAGYEDIPMELQYPDGLKWNCELDTSTQKGIITNTDTLNCQPEPCRVYRTRKLYLVFRQSQILNNALSMSGLATDWTPGVVRARLLG